jgi:hypothetical protein
VRVRETPGGTEVGLMEPGTLFVITGAAVCGDDGLRWWQLETLDEALSGWSAEGFAPDEYLLVPENDI